jgi:hypothetical protein
MEGMTFNDTAAAYGLFHVVFADVVDHLAAATFRLRKRKEQGLPFEKVFKQDASKILGQFRDELKQFDKGSSVTENVHDLREACKTISTLMKWRNDRIHARVRMTDGGYALYDWRTRHRLQINRDQIVKNIELAINAMVVLEANLAPLIGLLRLDEELDKLFSAMPEFSAPEDTGAENATV